MQSTMVLCATSVRSKFPKKCPQAWAEIPKCSRPDRSPAWLRGFCLPGKARGRASARLMGLRQLPWPLACKDLPWIVFFWLARWNEQVERQCCRAGLALERRCEPCFLQSEMSVESYLETYPNHGPKHTQALGLQLLAHPAAMEAVVDSQEGSAPSRGKLQYWKRRLQVEFAKVRDALGSLGLAKAISRCLPVEERAVVRDALGLEDAELKGKVADSLAAASSNDPSLKVAIAKAAQEVIGTHSKSKKVLQVPGRRLWRRVKQNIPRKKPGRRNILNAQSVIQKVRLYLMENSNQTAKLMKVGECVLQVRNLKRSRHKLWNSSTSMRNLMSKALRYRHLKAHHKQFVQLRCKTDVCSYCHKFDWKVLSALRKDLKTCKGQIAALQSNYFDSLDQEWARLLQDGQVDPDGELSLQYVEKLKALLDSTAAKRISERTRAGTVKHRQEMKAAEAVARKVLKEHVGCLRCCYNHFATARRQHRAREALATDLPSSTVVIQFDFMQNMTWPLGPEEESSWWWATARCSMTTLGFFCHF